MGKIGDKFYIPIKARSKEELDKRIADNEKRGFRLHKIDEPRINTYRDVDYRVDGGGYTQYGKINKSHHTSFSAVMVKG